MSGWLKGTLRSFADSTANHRYAHITIDYTCIHESCAVLVVAIIIIGVRML